MKCFHFVITIILFALSLAVHAACDKCHSESEFCFCHEAESLFQSMNGYQGGTGGDSGVETDGSIQIVTPGSTTIISDDQIPINAVIFGGQPYGHQGFRIPSFEYQGASLEPRFQIRAVPFGPHVLTSGGESLIGSIGAINPGFNDASREASAAGFSEPSSPMVPPIEEVELTVEQYSKYSQSDWKELLARFADARKKIQDLNEKNEIIGELYKNAVSPADLLEAEELSNQVHRYSENDAAELMGQFQTLLQTALISTIEETNLCSLVIPIETSHAIQWVLGNFQYVYSALFQTLQGRSTSPEVINFSRYFRELRQQVRQLSHDPKYQQTAPYLLIGNAENDVGSAQEISNGLIRFLNAARGEGFRSFAFRYSGEASPYNQGSLFLFFLQGAAIIISPHLGIMMSHNINDVVHYIVNYNLILGVSGISNKVHISKI